jgi:intraflagellar transport protein 52
VELFDLDEAFSSEKTQITQLTNKCYQNDGKSTRKIDEKELEYFIQECGRILSVTHDDQKISGKEILYNVSLKIANYKKLDRE